MLALTITLRDNKVFVLSCSGSEVVRSWPLLLLAMIHSPRLARCDLRARTARRLLSTSDCCLLKADSDLAVKVKHAFQSDLEYAAVTGLLTIPLDSFLKAWQAVLPLDAQIVEGTNSLAQGMCTRAPNMKIPLLNARISIKKNVKLTPRFLADTDGEIDAYMEEPGRAKHSTTEQGTQSTNPSTTNQVVGIRGLGSREVERTTQLRPCFRATCSPNLSTNSERGYCTIYNQHVFKPRGKSRRAREPLYASTLC